MKKIRKILSGLFCFIMMLIAPLRIYATVPTSIPPNFGNKEDINGEIPPIPEHGQNNDQPKSSKWYDLQARELINHAIEDNIGMSKDSGTQFITIGQAASILSYTKAYLYSDHGYTTEFTKKYIEVQEQEILSMTDFECREVSELEPITREQLIHLTIHIYDMDIDEPAIDPAATNETALTIDEYSDCTMVSGCYRKDIQKALDLGYINGTDYGQLLPKSNATLNDLVAVIERVIHAHLHSHKVLITFMQLRTEWSKINYKFLKIPSYLMSLLFQIITVLFPSGCLLSFLGRKISDLIIRKKSRKRKHAYA